MGQRSRYSLGRSRMQFILYNNYWYKICYNPIGLRPVISLSPRHWKISKSYPPTSLIILFGTIIILFPINKSAIILHLDHHHPYKYNNLPILSIFIIQPIMEFLLDHKNLAKLLLLWNHYFYCNMRIIYTVYSELNLEWLSLDGSLCTKTRPKTLFWLPPAN
jgi:hypothetical protein